MYRIGELARRTGVAVKTIRHYSDVGVLPAAQITHTRYRLYTESDVVRLALIRTLRGAGFDLPTIGKLLHRTSDPLAIVRLHLNATEAQLSALRRQRVVLEMALRGGADEARSLEHLAQLASLARLDAHERERFLRDHLSRAIDGVPVDKKWWVTFSAAALPELPDNPTDDQLAAWLELAALLADESFTQDLRRRSKPYWEAASGARAKARAKAIARTMRAARRTQQAGLSPDVPRAQSLVRQWLVRMAPAFGRRPGPRFAEHFLRLLEEGYDPRAERYWELVARVRNQQYDARPALGFRWLVDALRAMSAA